MKEEKFKVIEYIRQLIILVDKELDNFPKKEIEIKNRIRTATYDILEIAYEANTINDKNKKQELITKVIAKIKIIDFMLNLSYDKKLITQRKYLVFARKIDDIAKFANGWIKTVAGQCSA